MPESIEKQAGTAPENKALTAASDAAAFVAQIFQDDQAAAATDAADAQADLPLAAVQWPPVPARWPQDAAQHLRGQRVLVLGLGASGLAMARWCARAGAQVTVADTRSAPPQLAAAAGRVAQRALYRRAAQRRVGGRAGRAPACTARPGWPRRRLRPWSMPPAPSVCRWAASWICLPKPWPPWPSSTAMRPKCWPLPAPMAKPRSPRSRGTCWSMRAGRWRWRAISAPACSTP